MAKKSKDDQITIDGNDYSVSELSENTTNQLANIQFVDEQIQQIRNKLAMADKARLEYNDALNIELAKIDNND